MVRLAVRGCGVDVDGELLWRFSVAGCPRWQLLVIFLGLVSVLARLEHGAGEGGRTQGGKAMGVAGRGCWWGGALDAIFVRMADPARLFFLLRYLGPNGPCWPWRHWVRS